MIDEIRGRGYWLVVIRPTRYESERVPHEDLEAVLGRVVVRLRGWDVPQISSRSPVGHANHHIFQSSRFQHYMEHWRFYESGQFIELTGMTEDWRDQSGLYPPSTTTWKHGAALGITDTTWRFTEFLELASRLAVTPAGDDEMNIQIKVVGLAGRSLAVDDPRRAPLFDDHVASVNELEFKRTVDRSVLLGERNEIAVDLARDLFLRFGWHAERGTLTDVQQELLERPR